MVRKKNRKAVRVARARTKTRICRPTNPRAVVLEQDDGTWLVEESSKYPARRQAKEPKPMATIEEKLTPVAVDAATRKTLASKQDVDNLYDLFRKLEARVDDVIENNLRHESQLDHLRDSLALVGSKLDAARSKLQTLAANMQSGSRYSTPRINKRSLATDAAIREWFAHNPHLQNSKGICLNLNVTDKGDQVHYAARLKCMAEAGELEVTKVGREAYYRPIPDEAEEES